MQKNNILLILLFILPVFCFSQNKTSDWELKKNESGILVYTRRVANSSFKELKSVAIVKTSLSSIIALLNDFVSYPKWVYKCGESSEVKKVNDTVCLHYQTVIAPWPISSRDFIVKVVQSQNPKSKVVTINSTSEPKSVPIKKNFVRIKLFTATWVLTPLKDGNIQIDYNLLVDPSGALPAWIVNLATVEGPFETMVEFKKIISQDKYQKAKVPSITEPSN